MKSIISTFVGMFLCHCASAEVQRDIVFKSRFDLGSSQNFITELRTFLGNNNFGDPYSQELKKPLVIDLAKALNEVPEDTQDWIREFQSVVKIKLFESDYKLVVEKFAYSIKDFNSEFKPGISTDQRVEYVTVNYVNGAHLKAEKISFEVQLKQTQTKEPIKFNIDLIEPEFLVSPDVVAHLPMGWSTSVLPENILLTLESVDIRKLMEIVVKNPDLIEFKIKDMIMPDVSIRIGHKEIKFDQAKIKKFFVTRKESMKIGVLDILNAQMSDRFENVIKDTPKKLLLPRTQKFSGEVNGDVIVQKMAVNNTGILQIDMDADFCESECDGNNSLIVKNRRQVTAEQYKKSLREINRNLIEKKSNVAVSIGENYMNQIIEGTIRAGLWEETLSKNKFVLGPEKAFILAEEKGELFSLYLDIIYPLYGAQRILVGRSELRFPVKFMISLKVKEVNDVPRFVIEVQKIATDHKMLLEGLEHIGLPTTVNSVRFKKKVLKGIMDDVSKFLNNRLVDVELKELKGTYLDNLKFYSDGNGRGTATIGFQKR